MPDEQPEAPVDEEGDQVRAWRVLGAMSLGYEWTDAVRIADDGVDLHELADLLSAGCSHALALKIRART